MFRVLGIYNFGYSQRTLQAQCTVGEEVSVWPKQICYWIDDASNGFSYYCPTLIPDTIFMYLVNVWNVSVHFILKTVNLRPILYEKLWMKVYLNNEKTHVGCWALHDILLGLKYHSDTLYSPRSHMCIMAYPVVEFSREGYKIRKVFG